MFVRRANPYRELEQALGVRFRKRALLEEALTHPSYRCEHREVAVDYQRMEFLGDAVMNLLMGEFLYARLPRQDEGTLTALRSRVVCEPALAEYARGIGLGAFLRIGKGDEAQGGRTRTALLADVLEAVMGAVFLDLGWRGARKVFERVIVAAGIDLDACPWSGNPKGRLQDISQRKWKAGPEYRVEAVNGPAHCRVFTVAVQLPDGATATASAATKQEAEVQAAAAMLALIAPEK